MFAVFGKLRHFKDVGAVTWASMSAFGFWLGFGV